MLHKRLQMLEELNDKLCDDVDIFEFSDEIKAKSKVPSSAHPSVLNDLKHQTIPVTIGLNRILEFDNSKTHAPYRWHPETWSLLRTTTETCIRVINASDLLSQEYQYLGIAFKAECCRFGIWFEKVMYLKREGNFARGASGAVSGASNLVSRTLAPLERELKKLGAEYRILQSLQRHSHS